MLTIRDQRVATYIPMISLCFFTFLSFNIYAQTNSYITPTSEIELEGILNQSDITISVSAIPVVTLPNTPVPSTTSFSILSNASTMSTLVPVYNQAGESWLLHLYFFHISELHWQVRVYVNSEAVDTTSSYGIPRILALNDPPHVIGMNLKFDSEGERIEVPADGIDGTITIPWLVGPSTNIKIKFTRFYAGEDSSPYANRIIDLKQNGCMVSVQTTPSPTPTPTPTPTPIETPTPTPTTTDSNYDQETIPNAPLSGKEKGKIYLLFPTLDDEDRYELVLQKNKSTLRLISSGNKIELTGLTKGKWKARYRILLQDSGESKYTKFSKSILVPFN